MSRRIRVVPCHVGSVSFRVKSDPCQAAPVSCRVKSAPCPCSAGRAVSDRGVSSCPCHVGATCPMQPCLAPLSPTLRPQASVLSQHTMLMSQKSQLWQCHNVQVPDRRSGPKSVKMVRNGSRIVARSWESTPGHAAAISKPLGPVPRPQITQNGPKWVQNGRQVLRIGPRACRGHFLASGTGPAAKNPPTMSKKCLFGGSRWGHFLV